MGHYKTNTDSKCEFFSKAAVLYITVTQCYVNRKNYWKKSPLVGVEPTTFELEVQRASPLRHRGCWHISHCYCVNNRENRRFSLCPGGYFRDFWVGMCRWDPGTLSLYESSFKSILLPYTRLNSQNPPPPPPPPLSQSSCFPETTEVANTVQPKQNRFHFFHIFEWQFPVRFP